MNRLSYVALLLALSVSASVSGQVTPANDRPLDFGLSFGKTKTRFDYPGGASVDTRLEFIRLDWYERFAPGFEMGLFGGKSLLTQTAHPATAGLEPDGYHVGIAVRGTFLTTAPVQPFVHATYTYQRVKEDDDNRSITLSWYEPQVRLGVMTGALGWLRIYGGAIWGSIDGRERISGTTSSTTDFERSARSGGFAGLDLNVEKDGYIGVEAHSGISRGAEIYFKKRF